MFHTTLAACLLPNHYDPPLEDREWCNKWNPAALLMSQTSLKWSAPGRLIKLVSGESGERNSESARFNVFDVAELVDILRSDPKTAREIANNPLLGKLWREADGILFEEREAGSSADDVARDLRDDLPFSIALVDALNRRRNDAIQNVLGVSAEGLKSLFRDVRMALAADHVRLVLLLEDITSWEGLDDSLIDVLVTDAETRSASSSGGDLCDLISVVGLTPQYMRTLKPNYRQRITHEIRLGDGADGELQDVVTVRDPERRVAFVSQYLAATRTDPDSLNAWRDDLTHGIERRPPNKCDSCVVREGCQSTFGSHDGIGLFPFTENAIAGFYDALKEDDGGMTWKTPRGLIQAVLSPTLSHPETLAEGRYPGSNIDRSTFTDQSQHLSGALTRMIEAHVDSVEDRARLRRMFTFWGAGGRAEITRDDAGDPLLHNIPKRVFEAFQAPWIGDNLSSARPDPIAIPPSDPTPVPRPDDPSPIGVGDPTPERPSGPRIPPPPGPASPAAPRPPSSYPRLNPDDIRLWRDAPGEKLRNGPLWQRALHRIINSIDRTSVGADLWIWERFLTPDQVKLAGTSKDTVHQFVVPLSEWVFSGLEAYALLTGENPHITPDESEYYKRQLARMMRRLEDELREFFDRRLSTTTDGKRWNPAIAAAQVLLVRAWLRGATLPLEATEVQFAALLSDESGAESDPKSRTKAWQDLVSGTSQSHSAIRTMLRRALATPQGGAAGFGLASGVVARDLVSLMRDGKASLAPPSIPPQHQANKILESLAEQLRLLTGLGTLTSKERDLISERAKRLGEFVRGHGIKAHARRLDDTISQADEELPSACPDRVRAWKGALERISSILQDKSTTDAVEAIIVDFVDNPDDLPTSTTELLGKLVRTKASTLEAVRESFVLGESAVEALLVHAQAATAGSEENEEGLEEVRQKGDALSEAVERARRVLAEAAS